MTEDLRDRARRAAVSVRDAVAGDPRYGRTSRLLMMAGDDVLVDPTPVPASELQQ